MLVVFLHNPFDRSSSELLRQARARYQRLEVYDFHSLRGLRHVQGAPALWLFRDDQDPFTDEPAYQAGPGKVDLDEVDAAARNCRVASIAVSPDVPVAGQPLTITVSLTDLDGKPVAGEEVIVWTPWTSYVATDGQRYTVVPGAAGEAEVVVERHADPSKHLASVKRTLTIAD